MSEGLESISSILCLRGLKQDVNLGWSKAERSQPQRVSFDIVLRFQSPPLACQSDELTETVCYQTLAELIQKKCCNREFRLIEHLGWEIFSLLKQNISPTVKLQLQLTKERPPIPQVENGAVFILSDWDHLK